MEKTFGISGIAAVAEWFWQHCEGYKVFAFYGEMGVGKTTFIHQLCENKGIIDAVSSPTFSLINAYKMPSGSTLYHIDLYRIKDEEEAREAGMEDALYSGEICMVEWPERALGIFPESRVEVHLSLQPDYTRHIKLFYRS
jgi:tRNA threonylcarbamoyladenosine biosynthesis protein TsaE